MKKALFIINSLGNGGAERVCINLAKELVRRNYKVDFITLDLNQNNQESYEIDKEFNVYDLKIKSNNKIIKLVKTFFSINKFNKIVKDNEKKENYDLITSHIPTSNILTRFSCVKKRAMYVFHLNLSHYGNQKSLIFKIILKILFNKKKIIAVSDGIRNECIKDYKMNEKYIKTIYNPINYEEITNKAKCSISLKDDYILQVGRFTKQKRQDRMLEVFFKRKILQ